jgi:hypothetical protein
VSGKFPAIIVDCHNRPAAIDVYAFAIKRRDRRVATAVRQFAEESVFAGFAGARRLRDHFDLFARHDAPSNKSAALAANVDEFDARRIS